MRMTRYASCYYPEFISFTELTALPKRRLWKGEINICSWIQDLLTDASCDVTPVIVEVLPKQAIHAVDASAVIQGEYITPSLISGSPSLRHWCLVPSLHYSLFIMMLSQFSCGRETGTSAIWKWHVCNVPPLTVHAEFCLFLSNFCWYFQNMHLCFRIKSSLLFACLHDSCWRNLFLH